MKGFLIVKIEIIRIFNGYGYKKEREETVSLFLFWFFSLSLTLGFAQVYSITLVKCITST